MQIAEIARLALWLALCLLPLAWWHHHYGGDQ